MKNTINSYQSPPPPPRGRIWSGDDDDDSIPVMSTYGNNKGILPGYPLPQSNMPKCFIIRVVVVVVVAVLLLYHRRRRLLRLQPIQVVRRKRHWRNRPLRTSWSLALLWWQSDDCHFLTSTRTLLWRRNGMSYPRNNKMSYSMYGTWPRPRIGPTDDTCFCHGKWPWKHMRTKWPSVGWP